MLETKKDIGAAKDTEERFWSRGTRAIPERNSEAFWKDMSPATLLLTTLSDLPSFLFSLLRHSRSEIRCVPDHVVVVRSKDRSSALPVRSDDEAPCRRGRILPRSAAAPTAGADPGLVRHGGDWPKTVSLCRTAGGRQQQQEEEPHQQRQTTRRLLLRCSAWWLPRPGTPTRRCAMCDPKWSASWTTKPMAIRVRPRRRTRRHWWCSTTDHSFCRDFRDFVRFSWRLQEEAVGDAYVPHLQLVLFHPRAVHQTYASASNASDDVDDERAAADYTIRSPFPTVHLLRERDVLRAVQSGYPLRSSGRLARPEPGAHARAGTGRLPVSFKSLLQPQPQQQNTSFLILTPDKEGCLKINKSVTPS